MQGDAARSSEVEPTDGQALFAEFQRAERYADALREIADYDPNVPPPSTDHVHVLQMKAREALLHG